MANESVLILADDLIWGGRLADLVGRLGRHVLRARDLAAFESALPASGDVIIDLTARAYDGIAAVDLASRMGHRVLCVGQHDDQALRNRARAAGADRVLAYRAVFDGGSNGLDRWLSSGPRSADGPAPDTRPADTSAAETTARAESTLSDRPEILGRSGR